MAYKEKATAIKYNNEFIKQAYDRINLTVPKGRKAELQAFVEQYRHGQSVNGFINSLIDEAMERERSVAVPGDPPAGGADGERQQAASEPFPGSTEWWALRAPKNAAEGGGGDADAGGAVSIFSPESQEPHTEVGVSPTPDAEPAPPELSPEAGGLPF